MDGRYFRYDVEGHLIDAWHEATGGGKGVPWAHFTYDGLGRLASAVYHDTVVAGDDTKSADDIFGGETVEFYVYDQHWRVTSVWRAGPKVSGTRPDAYCYERFTYSSAGLNGRGDAWLLDCPVLSEICTSGDGVTFDRVRRFLQNARGDVVGVQEAAPHTPDLSVRYSVYGFPEVVYDRDPYHTADFNGDGDVGTNADITAFFQCLSGNCCSTCDSTDVNRDGASGTDDDINAFFAVLGGGSAAPQPDLKDLRFGFRGYWWDDHLKLYHVRNRVYDPASFRWLQPDPAGYVDGMNLYAYCGGDPINCADPLGLDGYKLTRPIRGSQVGNFIDDSIDGLRELFNPESDLGKKAQKTVITAAAVTFAAAVVVTTFGGALIAAGGAYAIAGEVVFAAADGVGTYFTLKAAYEGLSGKDLNTGRELTEEEKALRAAEFLGGAAGGFLGAKAGGQIVGALAEMKLRVELARRGYSESKINEIIEAFKSGSIRTEVLQEPTKVYRYYQNPYGRSGNWWTTELYVDPVSDLALPPSNNGLFATEAVLPPGTRVFRGTVAPQEYVPGCRLPGGGEQLYIPDAPRIFP